ncbi:EsaB/YukD family protein [Pseudonocardia alni]|uniref:EsaB/YukD family protein n=1 Tax=Pseudonocardia alni TaxID=33907 RepID=UPI0027A47307|nr:hypothetical protein PaSha_15220 [Pseudonocardia alni]
MTSVLPAPAATGPGDAVPATTYGPVPGRWTRVGVHTPRGRLDVALPADVAVAELVPMVRELLGRAATDTPQAWRFTGPAGGPLPAGATLDELGVHEGELLHLGPPRPAPAPPVLDDAAETVAAAVRGAADAAGTARWSGTAAAVLATTAAGAVLSTVDGSWRPWACALAAAGAVVALLVAHRARDDDRLTTAAALCAVPAAATAGLTALPAPAGAGRCCSPPPGPVWPPPRVRRSRGRCPRSCSRSPWPPPGPPPRRWPGCCWRPR